MRAAAEARLISWRLGSLAVPATTSVACIGARRVILVGEFLLAEARHERVERGQDRRSLRPGLIPERRDSEVRIEFLDRELLAIVPASLRERGDSERGVRSGGAQRWRR